MGYAAFCLSRTWSGEFLAEQNSCSRARSEFYNDFLAGTWYCRGLSYSRGSAAAGQTQGNEEWGRGKSTMQGLIGDDRKAIGRTQEERRTGGLMSLQQQSMSGSERFDATQKDPRSLEALLPPKRQPEILAKVRNGDG